MSIKANQQLLDLSRFEALVHMQKSRILVLMAEFERFCASLDLFKLSPGENARDNRAFHEFLSANEQALRRFTDSTQDTNPESKSSDNNLIGAEIDYWRKRGMLVFQPNSHNFQKAKPILTERRGIHLLLLATRELNDDLGMRKLAEITPTTPDDYLHYSLAFEANHPWEALEYVCTAIEMLKKDGEEASNRAAYCFYQLGKLTVKVGGKNRLEIPASDAVDKALSILPDEARWHAVKAKMLLTGSEGKSTALNYDKAKYHLEKAVNLAPKAGEFQHALGELELLIGNNVKAEDYFQAASELNPTQPGSWFELAKIQFQNGELDLATKSVDKALNIDPDYIEALLLRGEIALLSGNPRGAQSKAQSVLNSEPENLRALQLFARSLNSLGHTVKALEIMAGVIEQVEKPLDLELERARWLCKSDYIE